ncbi:hypothetical protein BC937DRAFT_91639 [Endogone sp. FLAS-F59071]|nr:hypothetical protein BC937DRAFT_91639 [Endogone sp. FLAS-F59071]|eukprot:RUS16066.1 hypothetical protein BC937DRAFT_91639 [Endogone sp. FLAS-F59071]
MISTSSVSTQLSQCNPRLCRRRSDACRGVLAARCKILRTKLNPQPGVFLKEIDLEVVLASTHTETIDVAMSPEICVEAYCAAVDLGLPKLRRMIMQHLDQKSIQDLSAASSLLNKAIAVRVILRNVRNPAQALLHVCPCHRTAEWPFQTSIRTFSQAPETQFEHVLLLCIIEWAWAQEREPPPATERHVVLKRLERLVVENFNNFDSNLAFQSRNAKFGKSLCSGDIVTFHLNMQGRTCSLSLNGASYVAWRNLPEKVYPAVSFYSYGRCRLRPRT